MKTNFSSKTQQAESPIALIFIKFTWYHKLNLFISFFISTPHDFCKMKTKIHKSALSHTHYDVAMEEIRAYKLRTNIKEMKGHIGDKKQKSKKR